VSDANKLAADPFDSRRTVFRVVRGYERLFRSTPTCGECVLYYNVRFPRTNNAAASKRRIIIIRKRVYAEKKPTRFVMSLVRERFLSFFFE